MLRVSLTSRSLAYAVVILATLLSLLPTIYMADMSLRGSVQSFNPVLISPHPSLHNYAKVIVQPHLLGSFLNSVIVSLSSVLLTVVFGLLASFALSRLRVVFGTAALLLILSALMLPLAALLVPLTVLLSVLGLTNNYPGGDNRLPQVARRAEQSLQSITHPLVRGDSQDSRPASAGSARVQPLRLPAINPLTNQRCTRA